MVTIDYSRDSLLSPEAITSLKERYLLASETSPQEAFARVAKAFADDVDHAQRLYDYASKKWMMFATPVLVNGGNKRGLPISCYLGYVPDDTTGILNSYSEACQLTRNGGGIGYHLGDLRSDNEATSIGTKSTGVIGFIKPFETLMLAFAQGQNRRGAVATYMDMSHPEIEEFITIRKPGGDQNRKCWEHKVFHHAVNIPDAFMEAVKEDGNWSLIDPHSKTTKKTLKARDLWIKLLETRMETGEPYFMFIDEANRKLPQALKDKGLKIRQSNLCCVSGNTLLTVFDKLSGQPKQVAIQDVVGDTVETWNGEEWSEVVPYKAGLTNVWYVFSFDKNRDTKMSLREQIELYATPNHKFYLADGSVKTAEELYIMFNKGFPIELESFIVPGGTAKKRVWVHDLFCQKTNDILVPAYCVTEPKRGKVIFNGVLTGNSEIFLPTNEERTAVCCLSSVNLEMYDEWKDNELFISDMVRMLDNVLSSFISKAQNKAGFQRAVASALAERSIGLGAMGFHYYLQYKGVPFESALARGMNKAMFKHIKQKAVEASQQLAKERGEAPDMVGTGMRNAHLLAIAPNASIGDIIGTSPSIEPLSTNYFVKKTDSGSFISKNRHLQNLLGELCKDTEEVWKSIRDNGGSVQHLDFLTQDQKDTFKTAFELDQRWIVQHAADRQEFICQGQSVNLFFPNDTSKKELHEVHLMAYEQKLKGLYYCRSTAQGRVSSVGKPIERQEIKLDDSEPACLGCEG